MSAPNRFETEDGAAEMSRAGVNGAIPLSSLGPRAWARKTLQGHIKWIPPIVLLILFLLALVRFESTESSGHAAGAKSPADQFVEREVCPGEEVEFVLQWANDSEFPATIVKAAPSCGCIQTRLPAETIEPGATANIVCNLTATKSGGQRFTVRVEGGTPGRTEHRIFEFSYVASGPIRLEPPRLYIDRNKDGPERQIRIVSDGRTSCQIVDIVRLAPIPNLNLALADLPTGPCVIATVSGGPSARASEIARIIVQDANKTKHVFPMAVEID